MDSVWGWVSNFYYETDDRGVELYDKFTHGMDYLDDDPDYAISMLQEVKQMARSLGHDWWVQMATHWELQTLLHYKQDYSSVIDIAAQATVEVRKPQYTEFPQRVCLHEDLITAYFGRDPIGYRDMIQNAIDYMQSQVKPGIECYLCLQGLRVDFLLALEKYDEAKQIGLHFLEASQGEDHHLGSAYELLCQIAYARKEWKELENWALLGELVAKRAKSSSSPARVAEMIMWRAFYERRSGNEDLAWTLYKRAATTASNYPPGVYDGYYEAATAFFEVSGQLEDALKVRERHLEKIAKESRYYAEARCRLDIVRLHDLVKLPKDDVIKDAEAVIAKLKDPTIIRQKLEQYR